MVQSGVIVQNWPHVCGREISLDKPCFDVVLFDASGLCWWSGFAQILFKVFLRVASNFVWFPPLSTLGTKNPSVKDNWVSFWSGKWSRSPPSSPDGVSPHLAWWLPWQPYNSSLLLWCHPSCMMTLKPLRYVPHPLRALGAWTEAVSAIISLRGIIHYSSFSFWRPFFRNRQTRRKHQSLDSEAFPLPISDCMSGYPKNSVITLWPSLEGNVRAGFRCHCSASIHPGMRWWALLLVSTSNLYKRFPWSLLYIMWH